MNSTDHETLASAFVKEALTAHGALILAALIKLRSHNMMTNIESLHLLKVMESGANSAAAIESTRKIAEDAITRMCQHLLDLAVEVR